MKTIGVIGAGQMGNGIAHVAAQAGLSVVMRDLEDAYVRKGLATIGKNLQRGVDKGKMAADEKDAILSRIRGTTKLEDLAGCDLVVEAARISGKSLSAIPSRVQGGTLRRYFDPDAANPRRAGRLVWRSDVAVQNERFKTEG